MTDYHADYTLAEAERIGAAIGNALIAGDAAAQGFHPDWMPDRARGHVHRQPQPRILLQSMQPERDRGAVNPPSQFGRFGAGHEIAQRDKPPGIVDDPDQTFMEG